MVNDPDKNNQKRRLRQFDYDNSLCFQFNQQSQLCDICKAGADLVNGICISYCQDFSDLRNNLCLNCRFGYHLGNDKTCKLNIPYCTDYINETSNCKSCENGYQLITHNGQTVCNEIITNCQKQNFYSCEKCNDGFFLDFDQLNCCPRRYIYNCQEFRNDTCIKCIQGYKFGRNCDCVEEVEKDFNEKYICQENQYFVYPNLCIDIKIDRIKIDEEKLSVVANCIKYQQSGDCIQCEGEDIFAEAQQQQIDCQCEIDNKICQSDEDHYVLSLNNKIDQSLCYPRIRYCKNQIMNECTECCQNYQYDIESGSCCKIDLN